jgi:glucose/arabinose dehydrogenase
MVDAFNPPPTGPFARQNRPFTIVTVIALGALTWFTLTSSVFSGDGETTTASTVTTAIAGDTAASESTVATTSGDEGSTTTIATPPAAGSPLQGLAIEVMLEGLNQPVFATTAPGDERIYVVERGGQIQIYDPTTGLLLPEPFLDVTVKSRASIGIEVGLLGLAFHPEYQQNGRLFIHYTDVNNDTAVAEYARLDADTADPTSGEVFISVEREGVRHNAGMLEFGPDGYLYIAIGDGGLFEEFGQDPAYLLGVILRLDMDAGDPYAIPDDNPYAAGGGAPEVWAYGLRNPWRFSIDRSSNTMFIGDVGQADAEEVNAVGLEPVGYNFGWPVMEGFNCWIPATGCDTSGKVMPITAYSHADGCSVTGGYVYRGSLIPEHFGHYFYADWCLGWVKSFEYAGDTILNERDWTDDLGNPGMITSFGIDADGELLFTTFEGNLGRIIPVR